MIYFRGLLLACSLLFFFRWPVSAQDNKSVISGADFRPTADGQGVIVPPADEKLDSISLAGSHLQPADPVLGERVSGNSFVRELWQVHWRPNDPIDLYVIRPAGVTQPPVVIYLYGFPSDTQRFRDDRYCERVTRGGAAAIGFVGAFDGHRADHLSPRQWFIPELSEALSKTTHDVQMILNYLQSRGDLDMGRVGIFGQGSGGAVAILAAAADRRIRALDLLDPWGDWPDWLAKSNLVPEKLRGDYLKPEFLQHMQGFEPARYLPELKTRSIRVQFVDEYNEPEAAVKAIERAVPANGSVRHFSRAMDFRSATANGGLFRWMSTELKKSDPTSTQASAQPGLVH